MSMISAESRTALDRVSATGAKVRSRRKTDAPQKGVSYIRKRRISDQGPSRISPLQSLAQHSLLESRIASYFVHTLYKVRWQASVTLIRWAPLGWAGLGWCVRRSGRISCPPARRSSGVAGPSSSLVLYMLYTAHIVCSGDFTRHLITTYVVL